MWTAMGPELRRQIRELKLVFTCEECVHHDDVTEACTLLYPNQPHRQATVDALLDGDRVFFCKMFEAK